MRCGGVRTGVARDRMLALRSAMVPRVFRRSRLGRASRSSRSPLGHRWRRLSARRNGEHHPAAGHGRSSRSRRRVVGAPGIDALAVGRDAGVAENHGSVSHVRFAREKIGSSVTSVRRGIRKFCTIHSAHWVQNRVANQLRLSFRPTGMWVSQKILRRPASDRSSRNDREQRPLMAAPM